MIRRSMTYVAAGLLVLATSPVPPSLALQKSGPAAGGGSKIGSRLYRGTVGAKLAIYMSLQQAGTSLAGWYAYERAPGRQTLRGAVTPAGTVTLAETDAAGRATGRISAQRDASGDLAGTWASPDGKKQLRFAARLEPQPFAGTWAWDGGSAQFTLELKQAGARIKGYHTAIARDGKRIDDATPDTGSPKDDAPSIVGDVHGDTAEVRFSSAYTEGAGGTARIEWRGSKLVWRITASHGEHYFPTDATLTREAQKPAKGR